MTAETGSPRTRRAILASGLAAGLATVASAFARPSPANAVSGSFDSNSALISALEARNTGTSGGPAYGVLAVTTCTTGTAVRGVASAATGKTHGVYGYSSSTSGTGVNGWAPAATGSTYGVYGQSDSTSGVGVCGGSPGSSTGVIGSSGKVNPAHPPKTGVYGYAAQDATATGVRGESTVGRGVVGVAASGIGVRAHAPTGYGIHATTTTGIGVYATTGGPKSGTALRTVGRVRFDNSVGIATVAASTSSVTVTPGIDLTATSAVVATLQGSAGGTTSVRCVTVNSTADTFTIYLTANATAAVKVAWHVFG